MTPKMMHQQAFWDSSGDISARPKNPQNAKKLSRAQTPPLLLRRFKAPSLQILLTHQLLQPKFNNKQGKNKKRQSSR